MAFQIGFYIRNSRFQETFPFRMPFIPSSKSYLQHITLVDGLVSVNKRVLMARAGCKNVLITKCGTLHYIKLKLYTVGNQQDREFLDPRKYYG